jgi:hypothetical protein
MINRITDKKRIPEILQLAKQIKVWDFDIRELAMFLETQMDNPAVLVLLDDEKRCFSISSIYRDMVTPYIVIMYAWSNPQFPNISVEEIEIIKKWAKSLDISEIKICVRKNVQAFMKKYGFSIDGTLLRMEVENG